MERSFSLRRLHPVTPFTFPAWYARMGYAGYRGGQRDCARDLGVTREHVRLLSRGEREPSATLVKLCLVLAPRFKIASPDIMTATEIGEAFDQSIHDYWRGRPLTKPR